MLFRIEMDQSTASNKGGVERLTTRGIIGLVFLSTTLNAYANNDRPL